MKRIFALLMTVVLVVAMSVPAFAALGEFISSPSGVPAPQIIDYKPLTDACQAKLVITPYAERHNLDDATRALIEKAYNDIVNSQVINNQLKEELVKLAADLKIDYSALAIGNLFDIAYYNCTEHTDHKGFTITIKPEIAENFVGMLHLNAEGKWELLDASFDEVNNTITFTVATLSPFAIVYNTKPDAPITGDSSNAWIYITLMVASVAALGTIAYNLKKREN